MIEMLNGKKGNQKERGFILITSYLLIALLEVFSIAFFSRSTTFYQAVERNQNKILAFNMAEAAIDQSMAQLQSNENYAGNTTYTTLGNNGGYQMSVCPPTCTGLAAPLSSNVRLIQATGYAPSNVITAKAYETRTITTYVDLDKTPFEYAVFGDSSVTLNGSSGAIDSYDSDDGVYGGANVGTNGDIASDGTITNNNTEVNGETVENPGIDCTAGSTGLINLGSLSITGSNAVTLAAGSYHYSSIKITGSGKLNLTGAVTLYVDGEIDIGGQGVATSSNIPSNLFIIATSDKSIKVAGSGEFHGVIYAPASTVTSSAGEYFGAVIAKNFTQNGNGDVHYDESLADLEAPCIQVDMLSWQESNTAVS